MTITAEQAHALQAGITPGRWKTTDALGTYGTLCYERIDTSGDVFIANVWHSDDHGFMPDRRDRAANSTAIAAVPDMLDTIITQAARISELEAENAGLARERDEAIAALARLIQEAREDQVRKDAGIAEVKPRKGGRSTSGPHHAGIRHGRDEASRLILAQLTQKDEAND